jgi:Tol biopolymer transport system component
MRGAVMAFAATLLLAGSPPPQGSIAYDDFAGSGDQIQLFRERPDGSGRVRLTGGAGSYLQPVWSPDGRRLVAVGGPGLVVLTRGGRVLRRLRVSGSAHEPRWSHDGTRIAYLELHCQDPLGHEDPACADLWIVRADGTGRRRLSASGVDASQGLGTLYSWSPDGKSIAYVSHNGIAAVEVATGRTRLLHRSPHLITQYPAWSPDGRWIAFALQRAPGRVSDLVAVAPNGRGLHRLRHVDVLEPRWSPDGRRIAYLIDLPDGLGWGVVVASADGSHAIRVGTSSDYQALVWSPDSSRVLYRGPGTTLEIAAADGHGRPTRIRGGDDPDWGA